MVGFVLIVAIVNKQFVTAFLLPARFASRSLTLQIGDITYQAASLTCPSLDFFGISLCLCTLLQHLKSLLVALFDGFADEEKKRHLSLSWRVVIFLLRFKSVELTKLQVIGNKEIFCSILVRFGGGGGDWGGCQLLGMGGYVANRQ